MKIILPVLLREKGFTLLELIVVFSIIAILSTFGVASFVNYSRVQTLQSADGDLVAILNTAKSKASSQVKPDSCVGSLSGYGVDINVNTSSYALTFTCSGNPSAVQVSSAKLPTGVTFSSAPASIFFSVLTGVVTDSSIVLSGFGLPNKTITVSSVGVISSN